MLRRLLLSFLCVASLLPGCALLPGTSVPAAAQTPVVGQTSSGRFAPHPVPHPAPLQPPVAAAPTNVQSSSSTQGSALAAQNTALAAQNAALSGQNAALSGQNAALSAQVAEEIAQAAAAQAQSATAQAQSAAAQAQSATAQASAAAAQAQSAALSTQVSTLTQQAASLAQQVTMLTPGVWGQPWASPRTDGSGLVYIHSILAPFNGAVLGQNGAYGTVAGWRSTIEENKSYGVDGIAADLFVNTAIETDELTTLFQATNAENAACTVNGIIQNNGHGVTRSSVLLTPDMSGLPEDPANMTTLANLLVPFLADPACASYQGHPVLSTYTGDGGGAAVVTAVYVPFLAQINAGLSALGKPSVLFWPGWGGDSGSTAAQELAAVGGIGAWQFGINTTPLGLSSPLPAQEALAASVQNYTTATGKPALWMQGIFPLGYWKPLGHTASSGKLYNEYHGMQALATNMASAILTQHPAWIELLTLDDASEGTASGAGAASEYLPGHWDEIPPVNTPDFYQTNAGLHVAEEYFNQWYKTKTQPVIASDQVIVSNRTQLAAASYAPTADATGPLTYVNGAAGDPPGLQNCVDVMCLLTGSGQVEVSGVTATPTILPAPAGVSQLTFPVTQAGTPVVSVIRNGQVRRQLTGHAIAATAALVNLNPASYASSPGIKFALSVPVPTPALPVDRAGILVRATVPTFRCLGVQNFAAYDLSTPTPTLFAQNSLNDPAYLAGGSLAGGKLSASTLAGADVLTEATGYDYTTLAAPLGGATAAYPLYFGNDNETSWALAKPLPSSHVRAHCRVIKTSTDPDGVGGVCFLCSTGDTYHGREYLAEISEYQGPDTLIIKAEDNASGDTNSQGAAVLGTLALNTLALGEWYDLDFDTDGTTLTATATPSNQQL